MAVSTAKYICEPPARCVIGPFHNRCRGVDCGNNGGAVWSTTGRRHVQSEADDEVAPVFLLGPLIEATLDALDDLPELAVIKHPNKDDAGMGALRLGPFSGQRREVAAVARDHYTVLARGKFEYRGIVEPFEGGLFSESEHVVSGGAQPAGDPRGERLASSNSRTGRGYELEVRCTKG
jgi:hypothetical protein